MGNFLCHLGLGLGRGLAIHDDKQSNNNHKSDNRSLNKRVAHFSLQLSSRSIEDCLAIPQFQESKLLLTVALPSAAPGFHLMAQDVCLSSRHHFSILANKKEEEKGRTGHCFLRGPPRSSTNISAYFSSVGIWSPGRPGLF